MCCCNDINFYRSTHIQYSIDHLFVVEFEPFFIHKSKRTGNAAKLVTSLHRNADSNIFILVFSKYQIHNPEIQFIADAVVIIIYLNSNPRCYIYYGTLCQCVLNDT